MRGMVGRRRLARTGAAPPCTVGGVAGDRTRVGRPTLASLRASAIAENCADSKAGRGWKALRSEDYGDATISDARCAVSMIIPAIVQWYASRVRFLSGCAIRAMDLYTSLHTALSRGSAYVWLSMRRAVLPPPAIRVNGKARGDHSCDPAVLP